MKTEPVYNKKEFGLLRFHFKQCSLDSVMMCNFERIKLYLNINSPNNLFVGGFSNYKLER